MSQDVPDKATARAKSSGSAHLEVNVPGISPIDQNDCGVAGSNQSGANLNDETRRRIILGIKGEGSRGICRSVVAINAREKRLAAEIRSAQIIIGWRSKAGKVVVGHGEISVRLGRSRVPRMERAVGDDAGRESGDSRTRAYSDAPRNIASATVGHSGSTQNSEILGRSERLGVKFGCGNRQGGQDDERTWDESATERDGSIIDSPAFSRAHAAEPAATTGFWSQDAG
jgi:hypothetical protein